MNNLIIYFAAATFLSTLLGGFMAIRLRKILHYFFAFSSGSLIAVSFFDLLPESLQIAANANFSTIYIMITVVASFFFYSLLERFFLTHHHHEANEHGHMMGPLGASGLIVHSFFDGLAVGAAFQANFAAGIVVAIAIVFHDFNDGINTVILMLKNAQHVKNAKLFLVAGSLAPVLGVAATTFFSLNPIHLSLILAAFVGEFLYLGATSLLPDTYRHSPVKMALSMGLGIVLIFLVASVISF